MKSGMQGADKWEENRLRDKMNAYSMTNKLSLFKQNPLDKEAVFPLSKFFQESEIEVFEMLVRENVYEMFESMRIYVERNGRPYNYLTSVRKLNEERSKVLHKEEEEEKVRLEQEAVEKKEGN